MALYLVYMLFKLRPHGFNWNGAGLVFFTIKLEQG